jgi:glycosyltransferase involved in cell wall biosynthesis
MGYRFQRITTTDYSYLQPFLARNPQYKNLNYRELYDFYIRRCDGWHSNYSAHLPKLGYETEDICVNFEHLQKLWATEHGLNYNSDNWLREIVTAQVKAFRPEVIFLDDLYVTDADFRKFLREICPNPVKIVAWHASPTQDYSLFRDLDLVLTCTPRFTEDMRAHGANAMLMMHAFEPSILELIPRDTKREFDFTFMGSLILEDGFHNQRFELIRRLLERTGLQVWGRLTESRKNSPRRQLAARVIYRMNRQLKEFGASDALVGQLSKLDQLYQHGPLTKAVLRAHPGRFHDPVIAIEYFRLLAQSKINLNSHIDCAEEYAGNIRLFEATGMGACLMTDWKVNLPEMFEADAEIVTYRSADECAEKVNYLLAHAEELAAIAAAGQRRTLRDHTYLNRSAQLAEILQELISGKMCLA